MADSNTHTNAAACSENPHPEQKNEFLGTGVMYSIDVVDEAGYAHHMVLSLDVTIDLIQDLLSHPVLAEYLTSDDPDSP